MPQPGLALGEGLLYEAAHRTRASCGKKAFLSLPLLIGLGLAVLLSVGGGGQPAPVDMAAWTRTQPVRAQQSAAQHTMAPAKAVPQMPLARAQARAAVAAAAAQRFAVVAAAEAAEAAVFAEAAAAAAEPRAFGRRQAGFAALGGLAAAGAAWQQPLPARAASDIKLVTFDGEPATSHTWSVVRGEASDPTAKKGELKFKGRVGSTIRGNADPFILTNFDKKPFVDISSCEGIALTAQSINKQTVKNLGGETVDDSWDEFKGFSLSIGNKGGDFGGLKYGYKAKFTPPLNEFGVVKIPFKDFTNSWDVNTGQPTQTGPEYSPDQATLQNIKRMGLWAEEFTGKFKIFITDISGYNCK